jgi:Zn-dependent hydrolases, including glyoxylases
MKYGLLVILICISTSLFSQSTVNYKVYAIKFADVNQYIQVKDIAINPPTKDSVNLVFMIWLLKGSNGKNILVDAGFERNSSAFFPGISKYIRPDSALEALGVSPQDISDIIITHPHADHINGIDLFPKATIWMQKNDYEFFVSDSGRKKYDSIDIAKTKYVNSIGKLRLINGDSIEIIPGLRVFIGSKHTYESQYVLVNTATDKVLIASDNVWFYYNLNNMVSIPLTLDQNAYIRQMKRMKTLVKPELIIPGHDGLLFTRFKEIKPGVLFIR